MSPHQKTLIILTPGFPANESDTTCLPAQQQFVKAVQRHFPAIQMIILTLKYPFTFSNYYWHNIRVISFGIQKGFYRQFAWMQVWKALKQIKKKHDVLGLLCFWCTESALIGNWFGRIYHLPHYNWILGQDAKRNNFCIKWMRPKSDELIALSDFLANEFYKNHGVKPAHIIPNGIDTALFEEYAGARNIDVLGAGYLAPLKQYDMFIDIIKELSCYFPVLKAMICGKGEEEQRLLSKIKDLQVCEQVSLTGELPHSEVVRLMQQTKIFLHPSSYEGFSAACLEALYAGAHVISFCKPMNKEISHWHIVHNQEEMWQKAIKLLKDPQLDQKPVIAYSLDETVKSVMKLFDH